MEAMKIPALLTAGLAGTALAQSPPALDLGGPRTRAERPVVAVEVGTNDFDVYELSADLAGATLVESGLRFERLVLGGARYMDAHRMDRPRQEQVQGLDPWIGLPDGGQLLRASQRNSVGLLHVPATGTPRWAARHDGTNHPADLLETVSVSLDGRWLVYATHPDLGGNVYRVDLLRGGSAVDLTAAQPPLTVDPTSLRSTPHGAWFLAGGELWSGASVATMVDTARLPGEALHFDLVASDEGLHVAVVAQSDEASRRVLVASRDGVVIPVTGDPQPIELPGTAEPLGPYLALSPDGSRLAWLTDGPPQELQVAQVVAQPLETHVTSLPDFPIYIDNIGIIGFASPTQVCYLAGDVVLQTVNEDDLIGVADMYATVTTDDGVPTTWNLTRTSGQVWPPFTIPATLSIESGALDAGGERFLLVSELDETHELLGFPIYSGGYYHASSNMQTLLPDLAHAPTLYHAGSSVLVTSEPDGVGQLRVHRVDPVAGQPMTIELIETFDVGTELRGVRGRSGFDSFVASDNDDELWISTAGGTHQPWIAAGAVNRIYETASLLSGHRIIVGIETNSGVNQPAVVLGPGNIVALPLPALPCRVLR